jgi:protein TonB
MIMLKLTPTNLNLDEVVFENRNKSYGAYQLRKSYPEHLTRSFFSVLLFFTLIALISYFLRDTTKQLTIDKIEKQSQVIVDKYLDLSELEKALGIGVASTVTQSDNNNFEVVRDQQIERIKRKPPVQPIHTFSNPFTSTSSVSTTNLGISSTGLPTPGSLKLGIGTPAPPMFDQVEVMPSFKDGSLNEYLSQQIDYPSAAVTAGVSGAVIILFEIDEKGNVQNPRIEQGMGYGCDQEALRVVSLMPQWTPAIQNGRPVKVLMRLPISFMLTN